MSKRTRGLNNRLIGSRGVVIKNRFAHITVGTKFAVITTGKGKTLHNKGTPKYAKALRHVTKRSK